MTSPRIESGKDLFGWLLNLRKSELLTELDWLGIVTDTLDDEGEFPEAWRDEARVLLEEELGSAGSG